jgi:hypothetical protein
MVDIRKLKKKKKIENYVGSFYEKRIYDKDFQLSTTLNLKKK